MFWNYVIPDGSTTRRVPVPRRRRFGTMSFQMVLLHGARVFGDEASFGTMSFQMVLLPRCNSAESSVCFGTMSFQMVLLPLTASQHGSMGFGTMSFQMVLLLTVSPPYTPIVFWNYVIPDGSTTSDPRCPAVHPFWNYVIPDRRRLRA